MGTLSKKRKCIIFGAIPVSTKLINEIEKEAFIICADAGYANAKAMGLHVDLAIGDWDSISKEEIIADEIITLPHEKDDTDLHFAAKYTVEQKFEEVQLLGVLGGRFDHTIANINTLTFLTKQHVFAYAQDETTYCTVIENSSITLPRKENKYISVFSLCEKSKGVSLKGLHYPLQNATIYNSFPVGVSNEFEKDEAVISVEDGTLLIITVKE